VERQVYIFAILYLMPNIPAVLVPMRFDVPYPVPPDWYY